VPRETAPVTPSAPSSDASPARRTASEGQRASRFRELRLSPQHRPRHPQHWPRGSRAFYGSFRPISVSIGASSPPTTGAAVDQPIDRLPGDGE
jgi:hypothetical protein